MSEVTNMVPLTDFDWDNVGKTADIYKAEDRERMEAMYDQTLSTLTEHEVKMGHVIEIGRAHV